MNEEEFGIPCGKGRALRKSEFSIQNLRGGIPWLVVASASQLSPIRSYRPPKMLLEMPGSQGPELHLPLQHQNLVLSNPDSKLG